MRRARTLIGLILFPLLIMIQHLTYYGFRSILSQLIAGPTAQGGLGLPPQEAAMARGVLIGTVYLATLVGGAAAIGIGARRVLVLGFTLSSLAYVTLCFVTPGSWMASMVFLGAATGLSLAGFYGAAAEQLAEARPMTLAALFASMVFALNLGSLSASVVAQLLSGGFSSPATLGSSPHWSFETSLIFDAVLMGTASGVVAAVFVVDRDRDGHPVKPAPVVPRPAFALLLLAAVMIPCYLMTNLQTPETTMRSDVTRAMLQFGVTTGARLLVLVAFIALAALGSRASLLRPLGGGLLVMALGGALYLAGSNAAVSTLANVGSDICEALALTLIAIVTPRRYAPGAFAIWLTMSRTVTTNWILGGDAPIGWVVAVGTLGCLVAGTALLVRGREIEAAHFRAPGAASEMA